MKIKDRRLSNEAISYILISISDMLDSGINILSTMDIIENTISGNSNKLLMKRIKENIKSGHSISEAFGKEDSVPKLCKEIVAIGEDTGHLSKVLVLLSNYYKKRASLKKQILGSLTYPIMLLFLLIMMIFFLFMVLVPSFNEMYSSMEIIPTGFLKIMFKVREFADENTLVFLLYILIYAIVLPTMLFIYFVKGLVSRNILKLKIIFQFREYMMLMILNLIFESGINIQKAFGKFSEEIKIPMLKIHLKEISDGLLRGKSIKDILKAEGIFSEYTLAMVSIGEETGKISDNINRALVKAEESLLLKTKRLSNAIQPAFIIIISFIIVGVMLGFLMPLYQGIHI